MMLYDTRKGRPHSAGRPSGKAFCEPIGYEATSWVFST
jgi:hypothetical protein